MTQAGPRRQIVEIVTFASVGIGATIINYIAAVLAIERFGLLAWQANMIGFLLALPVSYLGHAYATFSAKRYGRDAAVTGQSFRRFVMTAGTAFGLNQTAIVILIDGLGWPHRPVLIAIYAGVAIFLFLASKFWAFAGQKRG